jgi:hypothetical protein
MSFNGGFDNINNTDGCTYCMACCVCWCIFTDMSGEQALLSILDQLGGTDKHMDSGPTGIKRVLVDAWSKAHPDKDGDVSLCNVLKTNYARACDWISKQKKAWKLRDMFPCECAGCKTRKGMVACTKDLTFCVMITVTSNQQTKMDSVLYLRGQCADQDTLKRIRDNNLFSAIALLSTNCVTALRVAEVPAWIGKDSGALIDHYITADLTVFRHVKGFVNLQRIGVLQIARKL